MRRLYAQQRHRPTFAGHLALVFDSAQPFAGAAFYVNSAHRVPR
jgi:hypothetical protein